MKIVRAYVVDTPLLVQGHTGLVAKVGDVVRLYLDQVADPALPAYIKATVEHPIVSKSNCTGTSYSFSYDEALLTGAITRLRYEDIVDVIVYSTQGRSVYESYLLTTDDSPPLSEAAWTDTVLRGPIGPTGATGLTGPSGAIETTTSILSKIAPGTGGVGVIGPEYQADALSGTVIPFGSPAAASRVISVLPYTSIRFTATEAGAAGNNITIDYANATIAQQSRTVATVIGNAVTIKQAAKAQMILSGASPSWINTPCYYVGTYEYASNAKTFSQNLLLPEPHVRVISNGIDWTIYGYIGFGNLVYRCAAVGQGSNEFPNGLMYSTPTIGEGYPPSLRPEVSAASQIIDAVNALVYPNKIVIAEAIGTVTGEVHYLAPRNLLGGSDANVVGAYKGQLYRNTLTSTWYKWNGTAWLEDIAALPVIPSATAPADTRSLWFDINNAKLKVFYDGYWIATS